ncbi:MAG TPA: hypothetical protein VHM70_22715 [Polyangiaceae bacterium]|jgi:hypothetical protein|nr:hypothetical protein [Polyangiaceae bacterium]
MNDAPEKPQLEPPSKAPPNDAALRAETAVLGNSVAWNRRKRAVLVPVPDTAFVPQLCANCLAPSSNSRLERCKSRSLLIPYCDACGTAASTLGTLRLASTLASTLLVTTLLLVLPGWYSRLGLLACLVIVFVAGALPLLAAVWLRRPTTAPRVAAYRAAFFVKDGVLACFNAEWGKRMIEGSPEAVVRTADGARELREPIFELWMGGAILLGVALLPRVHAYLMPALIVLNFGASAVDVEFDTGQKLRVEPTSLESANAGARLNIASGEHQLKLVSLEGALLEERRVRVIPGALHLATISGRGYCFWLERDSYGQAVDDSQRYRLLDPNQAFWTLEEVDSVFAPNPAATGDHASSGGTMTALRQGRCDQLPAGLGASARGLPGG